ncbi:MAG: hypothetical protein JNK60_10690, partial [Acidobacteria bacterium]|nr:hypothetical protein [Acidobacteriota bacterium]
MSASGFFVRGDFESQALRLARSASTAVLAGALAVFVVACADLPRAPLGLLLPFLALTLLAALLRVPSGHTHVGLEAAAVLPAVVLLGSWQAGVVLVGIASLLARAIERRRLPRREDLDDTSDL